MQLDGGPGSWGLYNCRSLPKCRVSSPVHSRENLKECARNTGVSCLSGGEDCPLRFLGLCVLPPFSLPLFSPTLLAGESVAGVVKGIMFFNIDQLFLPTLAGVLVADDCLLPVDVLSELCLSFAIDCVDEGKDNMLSKVRYIPPGVGCESWRTTSRCRLGAGRQGAVESRGPPLVRTSP